jgi:hypothetical protein
LNTPRILAGLAVVALAAGLTACGTASAPAAAPAPTVHVTVIAPASSVAPATSSPAPTKTVTAAPPQVVINNNPAPSTGTVYIQAPAYAPAAPSLTNCNGGTYEPVIIWAGVDTSCPFAANVAANYTGTGADYAYSPVTGLWYDMTCNSPSVDGSVGCYGGNNAYVVIGAEELGQ